MKHTVKDPALNLRLSEKVERLAQGSRAKSQTPVLTLRAKGGFFKEIRKNWVLFLMILPVVVYFFIQSYLPMVGIYLAFTRYDFAGGLFGSPFVGFENFKFLVSSGTLVQLTVNTVLYNLAFIFITAALQITCAIFLNDLPGRMFRKVTQSVMFFPYFISFVIVGTFAYNIFNYENGFLNTALKSVGLEPLDAYNTPGVWPPILVLFYIWKNLGYGVIIYMATLVTINREYYEAAQIDGATIFQQIRHITLPLITPTFIILLLFSLGGIMRGQFDLFYQVVGSNGNLFPTTDILDTYVYRTLRVNFDVGMGTAAGLYQSVFGFVVIMVVNYIIKRRREEYALF